MGFTDRCRILFCFALASLYAGPVAAQCEFSGLAANYTTADAAVTLSGSPSGGLFSGPGISGNQFDPAAAGAGTHSIFYATTTDYILDQSGSFSPDTTTEGWTTVRTIFGIALQDTDDAISTAIDIGFPFQFFGTEYSRLFASSNGNVAFTPYFESPWQASFIPDPATPNDMIALVRTDLDGESPMESEIKYKLVGTAPNRVFILSYDYVDPRDPSAEGYGTVPDVSTQLKLFEATQKIEIHTTENAAASQPSLQGIENSDGSRAYFVAGRNNQIWTATNDFVGFAGCNASQTVTVQGVYTIGGTLNGLANGNQIVLQNNGSEQLTLNANGNFTFGTPLVDASAYQVVVAAQPDSPVQTCEVSNGSGTVNGGAVSDIAVTCSTTVYELTYDAGANGSILGEASQSVEEGSDGSSVTAVPNAGFNFVQWSDGSIANPRTDTDVSADIAVTAEFNALPEPEPEPEPDPEPTLDEQPPTFGDLEEVNVDATGLLTTVPTLTAPEAVDAVDGNVTATPVGHPTQVQTGSHQLTWAAQDAAGNRAEEGQRLLVHPLISMGLDQEQPEGGRAVIKFLLNGEAADYPLTVGYRVGGTASGDDHNLSDGTITFEDGELEQRLVVNIHSDGTSDAMETIIVTLDASTTSDGAANFGIKRNQRITIVEHNLAPSVDVRLFQDGQRRQQIARNGGEVTVIANVDDPNPDDTHSFDWQFPDGTSVTHVDDTTKRIQPTSLNRGLQAVEVTVRDNHASPLGGLNREVFLVSERLPILSGSDDSDRDGEIDVVEGHGDSDNDGQPDYLDLITQTNVLSLKVEDGFRFLTEADPGVQLRLNEYALLYDADGAGLTPDELADEEGANLVGDEITNVGGYVDFQARELPPGATIRVVIPQRRPVPEQAVYRKYADGVWFTAVENADDGLASAAGDEGACPPPGSDAYSAGLTPGDWCVQLSITDGGANDADGEINGVIVDPGGIGTGTVAAPGSPSQLKTTGGGGSLSAGVLALLALLGLGLGKRSTARDSGYLLAAFGILALASLATPVRAADIITGYHPLYLSTSLGYVETDIDERELEQRFEEQGHTVDALSSDGSRSGWSLGVGYRATHRLGLEVDYINLGDVDISFESQTTDDDLATIYPESGHGAGVSMVYRQPLSLRWGARVRVGVFIWEGDFTTFQDSTSISQNEGRNEDLFYGLGADYTLSPEWSISGEIQRFAFDNDPTHMLSLGVRFRFMEWFDKSY